MASARHRANILSRSFTQIGIGTARGSDGRLYVDEVFRQPRSGSTTAAAGAAGPLDEVVVAMVLTPEPALPPE
jgi:hypothetical protein